VKKFGELTQMEKMVNEERALVEFKFGFEVNKKKVKLRKVTNPKLTT